MRSCKIFFCINILAVLLAVQPSKILAQGNAEAPGVSPPAPESAAPDVADPQEAPEAPAAESPPTDASPADASEAVDPAATPPAPPAPETALAPQGPTSAAFPDIVLSTNQGMVEDVSWLPPLDITNKFDVLEFILNALPDDVTVYPTENYFYFSFYHDSIKYAGNLRLDVAERDDGFVNFIYFEEFNGWHTGLAEYGSKLGPDDGVIVSKVDDLTYTIAFRERTVTFHLNDLSGVTPPPESVSPDETLIGPIFDESGLRLFLVFNKASKTFIYFLDETTHVTDRLLPIEYTDNMYLGQRTGFVFYRDEPHNRLVLVAVYAQNTGVNNYLDGPFDQLPDNFLEGDVLIDSILAVDPHLKGQLDRFGNTPDGESRYLIAPYMQYDDPQETTFIEDCAKNSQGAAYLQCFSFAY